MAHAHPVIAQLELVRSELRTAPEQYLRKAGRVCPRIMAVTKTQPESAIIPLLEYGHRLFGENRVQEAEGKFLPLRKKYPDIEVHLIGPLQSNKVKKALEIFDVIQTIDREKIATEIAAFFSQKLHLQTCAVMVQVNTGEEPQKAGVFPSDVDGFLEWCKNALNLPVNGVMCIPPVAEDAALHFALLKDIATRNGLPEISMGMSADYQLASVLGSTIVRVGSALFGERS